MKPIRKELNGTTFEWNPTLYGKGGWMSVGKTGKLSPARKVDSESLGNPTDDQLKSHNIEKPQPKEKDVTERIKDEIYIWKPEAMSGKGAWFVLGTRGGLVRTAGIAESKKLNNIMKNKERNKKNKEKENKATEQKETETKAVSGNTDEPKESPETEPKEVSEDNTIKDTGKDRNRSIAYRDAARTRRTGITSLIAKNLSSGEKFGTSIKSAISQKFKARVTGFKEKFDPINIGKAIGGNLGAAIMGRMTGRSTQDMNYFTGLRARQKVGTATLQQRLEPTLQSETTNRDPMHSKVSDNSRAKVKKGDSLADVLTKLYNLIKRISDDDIKRLELEKNFSKEKDAEKLKFLENLANLLGNSSGDKNSKSTKEEEESKSTMMGFLKSLGSSAKSVLGRLAGFLVSPFGVALLGVASFAVLAVILGDYLQDWAKGVSNMKQRTPTEIAAALENGSDPLIMKQAEDITGQKPKDITEAVEVLRNYIKNAPEESKGYVSEYDGAKDELDSIKDEYTKAQNSGATPEEVENIRSKLDQAQVDFRNLEIKIADKGGIDLLRKIVKEGSVEVPERKYNPEEKVAPRPIVGTGLKAAKQQAAANVWDKMNPDRDPLTGLKKEINPPESKETAVKTSTKEQEQLGNSAEKEGNREFTSAEATQFAESGNKAQTARVASGETTTTIPQSNESSKETTTQIPQSNSFGEKVQSSIQTFNETQRNAITKPTIVNVNNSKVIGSGGGAGEVNVTVGYNAKVRTDEISLLVSQFQCMRPV
jgi:hypothetical protein